MKLRTIFSSLQRRVVLILCLLVVSGLVYGRLTSPYDPGIFSQQPPLFIEPSEPTWDTKRDVEIEVVGEEDPKDRGFASIKGGVPIELQDLADYLNDPEMRKKYQQYGIDTPKGVLLYGPPGSGKTCKVKALEQEIKKSGCECISTTATRFSGMLVGQGAKNIRAIFDEARQRAERPGNESGKCIIFIDELDTLTRRNKKDVHEETKNMVRELLTQMDGLEHDHRVVVIGATNYPEEIDRSLLRAGRFDYKIEIALPDEDARLEILKYYAEDVVFADDIPWELVAEYTSNLSPAELKELISRAGRAALREDSSEITTEHVVEALKQIWAERRVQGDDDIAHKLATVDKAFKDPAKLVKGFAAIAGDIEEEILQLVQYLRGDIDYKKFGIEMPQGILLIGEPGTGKTLLARELAREAGCEFINAKGSEFIEKYVGVGAKRIRELFEKARKKAKAHKSGHTIIFIDEIDAIGGQRTTENGESQQTMGQLLTEMDGFYKDDTVIVVAATNRADDMDKALLRRFESQVKMQMPLRKKRRLILDMYTKNKPLGADVSLEQMAGTMTSGWTPAKLKNFVNEAAKIAASDGSETINRVHFEEAWDRVILGKLIKDIEQTSEEELMTAYHEAGHAIIPLLLPDTCDPLYKITIRPRAFALGVTYTVPDREKFSFHDNELRSVIIKALAGCAAEEIVYGKLSTGASNDFEKASATARDMICKYGMSDKIGKVSYKASPYKHSEVKTAEIDAEVTLLMNEMYVETKRLLNVNRDMLEKVAKRLYEKKTVFAEEVYDLLGLEPRVCVA